MLPVRGEDPEPERVPQEEQVEVHQDQDDVPAPRRVPEQAREDYPVEGGHRTESQQVDGTDWTRPFLLSREDRREEHEQEELWNDLRPGARAERGPSLAQGGGSP